VRRNFEIYYSGDKVKGAIMDWAYGSLNALVAQSKSCPFAVNTTIELKNITTSENNDI
jgi:hypothetical protein